METIKLLQKFSEKSEIVSILLFGSESKGTAHDKSDIDLAILFKRESVPSPLYLIEMKEELSETLNKDVDLVCLNTASPVIGMQILKYGKILLNKDPKKYYQFSMNLFTDYADLKMMRGPMEKKLLKRKYYG